MFTRPAKLIQQNPRDQSDLLCTVIDDEPRIILMKDWDRHRLIAVNLSRRHGHGR
jgi:hypothetical protein